MKKIVYLLILLSICIIPKTTFAATKINVSNDSELISAMESTSDNEITLTNNVEITYDSQLEAEDNVLMVTKGKHILNLNNHNIITESNLQADYGLITVLGGSLEIKGNGTISAPNVTLSVMGGTLTINGGTYNASDQNHVDNVLMSYSGKIIINKGTFTGYFYAEGPENSGGDTPSQGSSLPMLSSSVAATVHTNRAMASQKLGAPLDTKPSITINGGTFNSPTYLKNTDTTINGGTYAGDNAVEIIGSNSKIKVTDGTFNGDDIGFLLNTSLGDPLVQLNGGTYTCTNCGDQQISLGAVTIGPFTEQKDGTGLLRNALGENATIDDDTIIESTTEYNNANVYYYHTNNTVRVSTPVEPQQNEQSNKQNGAKVENPETNDNILLSVIALITSLSVILISTKKLNN